MNSGYLWDVKFGGSRPIIKIWCILKSVFSENRFRTWVQVIGWPIWFTNERPVFGVKPLELMFWLRSQKKLTLGILHTASSAPGVAVKNTLNKWLQANNSCTRNAKYEHILYRSCLFRKKCWHAPLSSGITSYLKMNLTDDKFIWVYIFSKQNVLYKNAPSWVVEKYGYLGNRREG